MGKGLPDWHRGIGITYQDLARIVMRPSYGGERMSSVSGAVAANSESLVINISGAGIIIGVHFWVSSSGTQKNDYAKAVVDGNDLPLPTFQEMNDNFFYQVPETAGFGTLFDDIDFKYAGGAGFGVTFDTSYQLYYIETHGRNPTANIKFTYALVP